MTQNGKITDAELNIMQVLWESRRSMTFREICEALPGAVKKVTIQTLISRLVEKGVLRQERQEVYHYTPLVTREEYEREKTEELIRKVYRGDVGKLLSALMDSKAIPEKDMEELRRFWQEAGNDA